MYICIHCIQILIKPINSSLSQGVNSNTLHKLFDELVKKYGPMVRLENPQQSPVVVVIDPNHIEALLRATMDNPVRLGFLSLKKIRLETPDNYFEGKTGLLTE